ncbi:beta-propeller fold lactonase family protein [Bacillus sp. 3103sda1]|uniref:beta-propeller fold lactonase family protein n=1 Tax=Bacillus sp. 3103sda1 TaxID=2953808 RepID=UPI00209CF937|nr:beta-propeller fold lactonase family protein [Bacillus sp. 3103sda1]MCP1123120.1 beta-propeller fold lactonase family protein [Bacillus sp. 3103sda1]
MKRLFMAVVLLLSIGIFASCGMKTSGKEEKRSTAVHSDNIVTSADGKWIYTANIDINTVTVMDAKSRKVVSEIAVGKEPRQLTISPDGTKLYVSCMYDNKVDVVSLDKKKVIDRIPTEIEPFGVVTNPNGTKLYVSNFRSGNVSVIDLEKKKTVQKIEIGDRPRTLAMTKDGKKLYVPHYLEGKISVVDTGSNKVKKVITLASSPDKEDRKKSQGIPNTLEQFVIAPDGKTAWVPHMLTNVDTPIQFEETVFPAVSIIDLEKDEEIIDQRKQLFEAMNVKNTKNETMIVSNPYDVAFNEKGTKAFVVMSGSEDLMVFDLTRGGNATQIVRRIPGSNPRGIMLLPKENTLVVHNAMSHDLAFLETGGNDSYAKVQADKKTVKLIAKDSLSKLVREGKEIFYSANSDKYAAGITGNNWMSCATCHSDGEINGLSLMTPKGKRNVPSNVLTTKTGLFMWDGSRDDFTDYIHTVQGEMGGMMEIDPGKELPKDVQHMYDALQAFLDDPNSFPVPKSPYRQGNGELTPTAKDGEQLFKGKANCLTCHGGDNFTNSTKAVDENGKLTTNNTNFLYNIGTANEIDTNYDGDARGGFQNKRLKGYFDPPTLRGVWATAPYLHDGSAKTVEEAVEKHQYEEKPQLSKQEVHAIAEYVKSIQ